MFRNFAVSTHLFLSSCMKNPSLTMFVLQPAPTIKPKSNFVVTEEIDALQKAMKGLGTDEKKIISVLTSCNNAQRQEIAAAYKNKFKKVKNIYEIFDFTQLLKFHTR